MTQTTRSPRARTALAVLTLASIQMLNATPAHAEGGTLEALAGVYSHVALSERVVKYCADQAIPELAQVQRAHQSWRQRVQADKVNRQFESALPEASLQSLKAKTEGVVEQLRKMGSPSQACQAFAQSWQGESMDMRQKYPLAYQANGDVASLRDAVPSTQAGKQRNDDEDTPRKPKQPARPEGTVYSVAQLEALNKQWWGNKTDGGAARQRAVAMGRIYVKGTVAKWQSGSYYLTSDDGTFAARNTAWAGIDLGHMLGKEVVMGGTLDETPNNNLRFRDTELVQDPSGLQASTLPSDIGLYRKQVDPSRIRTAPNKGLQARDIVAVLDHGYNQLGFGSGLEFVEDIYILMKDGMAYTRTDVPPADLDVQASRKLEPQYWVRWEATGKDKYRVLKQDDRGRFAKEWTPIGGISVRPWRPQETLNDSFSTRHFYGSMVVGGTSTMNSVSFKPDGRFETVGSSLSTTGMLQNLNGFNSSASSISDSKGTRSASGSNFQGADGGSVGAYSKGGKDDGADNRGNYRFDGYTLELRFDNGRVSRIMSFAWDDKLDHVYFQGESHSSSKRQ
ncbi:MAG: hypothetical protein EPO09_20205 [Aquabacterium sp.]|uniref:hypothetical protein n=1 Tax=Aquabacterium sp. TaxID=1872578 RepID=UPI00121B80C7|nr:hypothetical protein [Aquabacterium sp.]TAK85310.1 MAG: hypothetical protein EPO09_20205 [Aquabacterium sp.]